MARWWPSGRDPALAVRARPGVGRSPITRIIARAARLQPVGLTVVDHYFTDADEFIAGIGIRSFHSPGHTAGHIVFLWPAHGGVRFVGAAFANWRAASEARRPRTGTRRSPQSV